MGTLTAQQFIDRAGATLRDMGNERWPDAELLTFLSDAQRGAVLLKPDVNPAVRSVALVPGTRQSIPNDAFSLLRVVRNMGADGATPGAAIKASKEDDLDSSTPNWHTEDPAESVEQFVYDAEINRDIFYVSPPQPNPTTHQVEIIVSKVPAELTATTDVIELSDVYQPVLLAYMLFRAYSKLINTAGGNYPAMAASHYGQFERMLLGHERSEGRNDPLLQALTTLTKRAAEEQ